MLSSTIDCGRCLSIDVVIVIQKPLKPKSATSTVALVSFTHNSQGKQELIGLRYGFEYMLVTAQQGAHPFCFVVPCDVVQQTDSSTKRVPR